jgi:hypothetical protein
MPISQHSKWHILIFENWKEKICSIACRPNYIDNIVHDWLDVLYYTFPDSTDTKKNPEMCRKLGEECRPQLVKCHAMHKREWHFCSKQLVYST